MPLKTRSTQNKVEENDLGRKARKWVAVKATASQGCTSKVKWVEREFQSLMCLMAQTDIPIARYSEVIYVVFHCQNHRKNISGTQR